MHGLMPAHYVVVCDPSVRYHLSFSLVRAWPNAQFCCFFSVFSNLFCGCVGRYAGQEVPLYRSAPVAGQQAALKGPTGTTRLDAEGQDTCCGVRVEAAGGPPGESVLRLPA